MSKSEKNPREPMPGTLRHWREALPEERMAHLVKDTARGFSRSLQARLREHAVQYGHWTFLRILWQTDGLTQRQLSEQAGVAEPTTFSALKTMESLGYLTRQKLPDNRKQVRIFLTPKGASLRALLVPKAVDVNRIALAGISTEDIAATRRTLLAMIENLAGDDIAAGRGDDDTSASRTSKGSANWPGEALNGDAS
ncbi:MarR family winged helix-turn-helix transcriptional regulator [Paraburkholderia sediminicola]|uniref:MarR family winged helix-turn-helix transcriptional regulator n=1 Tax=Paraburkholderia rhynchosiae TaxID=487049 RepID=A0ACC7NLP1_9BURK